VRKLLADPCSYAALAGRRDTRRQTVDRQSVTDTPGRQLVGLRGSPPDTWFLGRTQVHVSNGTSIGSAVFVGFTVVTDNRLTDRPTRRQTERQTKRQASRGTDRQTDRQTDRRTDTPGHQQVPVCHRRRALRRRRLLGCGFGWAPKTTYWWGPVFPREKGQFGGHPNSHRDSGLDTVAIV